MIKKGFEKKTISFKEAIMSTREASRNLFVSKIITEKGLKKLKRKKIWKIFCLVVMIAHLIKLKIIYILYINFQIS